MMHAEGCTLQKDTIDREIATLQARTSTMSSAFDKRTQLLEERMEIVHLQERCKTSTRISKLTIRDMTMEMKELKAKLTTYEVEVGRLRAKIMQWDNYCGRNSMHFSKSVAGAATMVPTTKWLCSSARINSSLTTNFSIKVGLSILQMIPWAYATRSSRSSKYRWLWLH